MRGACEREDLQLDVLTGQFKGADIIIVTPPGEDCSAATRLFPEAVVLCIPDSADSAADDHWIHRTTSLHDIKWSQ